MTAPSVASLRAGAGFVLRTPTLPLTLEAWASGGEVGAAREYLARLIALPVVREALFVASPSLSEAIASWQAAPLSAAGQRVERSLVKYVARMMGRATPFGLFSGVSTGRLGATTELRLAPHAAYGRRTRLDNDYLFVLADLLARAPEARDRLTYRPNTSLDRVAGRLRYAAAVVAGKERSYQLVSVDPTPYLDATLARATPGATHAQLAGPLVSDEISATEADAFVDELIDAQLLVPALGIFVTGPEPLDGLLAQLGAAGLAGPRQILETTRAQLAALDAGVGNALESYAAIAAGLAPLGAAVDLARLFQVDLVKPATATLGKRVVADTVRVIEQLASIIPRRDRVFDEFKRAFTQRYEGQTVPLAAVLDEESGIGFETAQHPGSEGAPLLAGIIFPGRAGDDQVRWGAFEHALLARLGRVLAAGATELVLDDADLAALEIAAPLPLPDALSASIRVAAGPDPDAPLTILFEGAAGPSGARLLGRFSGASAEIAELVRAHHAAEEALRPDAVFAEIVHLNEGRIGNILCRPVMRAHEIVYLGVSGAPDDAQILLDDLLVSIRGDRVVLTSRRLGREVIPRLTTAHNFRLRSLVAYRFLAALAAQGTGGVSWQWGALASAPFLPRVRIGEVIVQRARWRLERAELAALTTAVRAANKDATKQPGVLAAVAALRAAHRLPRMFVIAAYDNELPIDLDNPLLAAAFADEASGVAALELTEMVPAEGALAVHGPEGGYANEIVLTLTRARSAMPAMVGAPASRIRRTFPPGSEWLFAKIYCGEATGDRVLTDAVGPVARAAVAAGDARQWFFLRYLDPEPHLRVRFRGEPGALLGSVLPALGRALEPLVDRGAVRTLVLDSYVRETERYGGDAGIELVEQLFWRDSEAVLGIVELLEGAEGATARWKLALRGIDSLLEHLGLPPDMRAQIYKEGRDRIGAELGAGTPLWAQIGERFTRERADLDAVFARDPARDADHDLEPGFTLLAARDLALAPIVAELRARDEAGQLAPRIRDLAWSVGHMHANRMLHASQRAQEMVLYDFLNRLHASRRARARR